MKLKSSLKKLVLMCSLLKIVAIFAANLRKSHVSI
jgi:hypothetical protein